MRFACRVTWIGVFIAVTYSTMLAATKAHVITFGKWTVVKLADSGENDRMVELKIRPLFVDGKLREFTFGMLHDITDRLFVVQRVIRFNDALPGDAGSGPRWVWQRSGWLVIDRSNGHITAANLAEFDPDYSSAVWYRDYVAYCGLTEDGKKLFAVVAQLGRRKPILSKPIGESVPDGGHPACDSPMWQREPTRVTFAAAGEPRFTFAVRGRSIELLSEEDDEP